MFLPVLDIIHYEPEKRWRKRYTNDNDSRTNVEDILDKLTKANAPFNIHHTTNNYYTIFYYSDKEII